MKSKRVKCFKLMMATALLIMGSTGCGNQIPELTEEQAEQLGEYAMVTLLKYDANQRSRLVDAATVEAYDMKQQELKELETMQKPEPTPEGMKPTADTPIVGSDRETSAQEPTMNIENSLSAPEGISISYLGYKTCNTYPENSSADTYFNLDASAGNKFLVMEFAVENKATSDIEVDFFSASSIFSADTGNGERYQAMTTMLLDDISTYSGRIPAGGKQDLVLMFEIEQSKADSLTELKLYFQKDGSTYQIQL